MTARYCTWYTGLNTECGNPARQERDGFPHCDVHADTFDALVRAEQALDACYPGDDLREVPIAPQV